MRGSLSNRSGCLVTQFLTCSRCRCNFFISFFNSDSSNKSVALARIPLSFPAAQPFPTICALYPKVRESTPSLPLPSLGICLFRFGVSSEPLKDAKMQISKRTWSGGRCVATCRASTCKKLLRWFSQRALEGSNVRHELAHADGGQGTLHGVLYATLCRSALSQNRTTTTLYFSLND